MNILVFTSAMIESEFVSFQNDARFKPNPSNQNFYAKLIKALSINNNVVVVSHRPFAKGMFDEKRLERKESIGNNIKYFYTCVKTGAKYKLFEEVKEITSVANKAVKTFVSGDFLIVTDTLRANLLKAAIKFGKSKHAKVVGMLTDNPANLTGSKKMYVKTVYKNVKKLDAVLSLSNGLLKAFNVLSKPNYIFEGLVDEKIETRKPLMGNYFFFGGALYERYGVKNLINAFIDSSLQEKLVIAGTGELRGYIFNNLEKNNKILYVSQLPKEDVYGYEQNAIANINPRPYVRKLDEESVPSKLLEYLASGTPTMSTMHTKLFEIFKEDVFWITNDSKEGIQKALEDFAKEDIKLLKANALNARKKVYDIYGVRPQGERITYFLETFSSSFNK